MNTASNEPTQVPLINWPWGTVSVIIACLVISFGLGETNDYESLDNLRRWGYLDAHSIWSGEYWGLLTSCFIHFEFIHLVFSVYWLWVLGGRFELEFGLLSYLTFFVCAAFISSSLQLAFSGSTGIGASGVGYALFGFAVLVRSIKPSFAAVMDNRIVVLWIVWLFGCIITTYFGLLPIGNVAHISGMIFGMLVASYYVLANKLARPALAALIILAWIPLFWSPWSMRWLSFKANKCHMDRDYNSAIYYYSRVIERAPDAAWAIWNRGCVFHDLKQYEKSSADLERAKSIDQSIENMQDR